MLLPAAFDPRLPEVGSKLFSMGGEGLVAHFARQHGVDVVLGASGASGARFSLSIGRLPRDNLLL
jgi:hypothetical protein